MPILVQAMEDFPRGGVHVAFHDNNDIDEKSSVSVDKHPSVKAKRRKKIKQLLDGQSSTSKDDLLVEDKEELAKIKEEDVNDSDELFKIPKKKSSKKQKRQMPTSFRNEEEEDEYFIVEPLTYDNIAVGFLSLGLVSEIKDHEIVVSLPGRTVGSIPITGVSKPYSKLLSRITQDQNEDVADLESFKPLSKLFAIGQVLIVKVIDIGERKDAKRQITLTCDPSQINCNYNATIINEDMMFVAAVQSIEDHGLVMDLGVKGVRAFLPKNRISTHKFTSIAIGQLIRCKVIKSEIQKLVCTVTLTANFSPNMVEAESLNSTLLLPGIQVEANIMQTHKTGLKVYFMELMGTIYQDHTSNPWELPAVMEKYSTISATVLYIHPTTGSIPALTMKKDLVPHKVLKGAFYPKGRSYKVKVERFEKRGVIVKLENGQKGIVSTRRCFANEDPTQASSLTQAFPAGSTHLCRILEHSAIDDIYIGSFAMANASEQRTIQDLKLGSVVTCTVINWTKLGALVLVDGLKALIHSNHFDKFSPKITPLRYPIHAKVKAKVFRVNMEQEKIHLTARKSLIKTELPAVSNINEMKRGQIYIGVLTKATKSGLIVQVVGGIMGFVPASLMDVPPAFICNKYNLGDIIKVKVVEVKPERPTIIFSLDMELESTNLPVAAKRIEAINIDPTSTSTDNKKDKKKKQKKKLKQKKDMNVILKDKKNFVKLESNPEDSTLHPLKRKVVSELRPIGLSFWGAEESPIKRDSTNLADGGDEVSSDQPKAKKVKITAKDGAKRKEADIREKESALADPTRVPQSIDDYELLVMASPNSSMCWIKYISFHLEAGDVDLGRKIGERALSVIPFNEEQERFNVWTALLNLENDFGNEETLKKAFENASRNCDALETYKTMVQIYVKSKKTAEAEKLYKIMTKKFPDNDAVWAMAAVFFYRIKNLDEARSLYTRAIYRLHKRHHVELISKFAQLELTFGDFEQGRSLYEKLVTTYPSRCDLWLVYVNQLIKHKDYTGVRNLFDRVIYSSVNPKKITPVFKRFLEFEKDHGTPESIAHMENSCTNYYNARFGLSAAGSQQQELVA